MYRKGLLIIVSVVVVALITLALFLNLIVFTKPTSPASKPIFSVTLSPLKQTLYVFQNQSTVYASGFYPSLRFTITGNATYPCGVVIWGGLSTDYNQPFTVNPKVGSYDGPESVNGNSKTFILNIFTHQINGTATYHVSVTDNLGNSVNSNKVQVLFKTRN